MPRRRRKQTLREAVIWRLIAAVVGFFVTFAITFIGASFGVDQMADALGIALISGSLIAILCLIFGPRILDGLGGI